MKLKYSSDIIQLVDALILNYAKFDTLYQSYSLTIHDLSDFELHKLSYLFMAHDSSLASEATGPDNSEFGKTMLPALLNILSRSHERDEEVEFIKSWREGVTNYFKDSIEELLQIRIKNYNDSHGCISKEEIFTPKESIKEINVWL